MLPDSFFGNAEAGRSHQATTEYLNGLADATRRFAILQTRQLMHRDARHFEMDVNAVEDGPEMRF